MNFTQSIHLHCLWYAYKLCYKNNAQQFLKTVQKCILFKLFFCHGIPSLPNSCFAILRRSSTCITATACCIEVLVGPHCIKHLARLSSPHIRWLNLDIHLHVKGKAVPVLNYLSITPWWRMECGGIAPPSIDGVINFTPRPLYPRV
jgi:hypothetical protein